MGDHASFVARMRRYADLVRDLLPRHVAFAPSAESATDVQVERAAVLAGAVIDADPSPATAFVDRLIELSTSDRLPRLTIVDRSGHHRPAYRGLLVYAWLASYRIFYETLPRAQFGRWEEGARAWCDLLEAQLTTIDLPDTGLPAGRGASVTEAAWAALALWVAGKVYIRDAWTDLAADTFGRIVRSQTSGGAFLRAGAGDNLETHAYHELLILHAAASYAVQAEDRVVAAAVARATEFHLRETQPDHATAQPWGVFAFVWNESTAPLADQMLHAAQTSSPGGIDAVSATLLADALYCLRLFL
jgi:hypothetical protein